MKDEAEQSNPSHGSHWLRIAFGVAANVAGVACVVWPVLPKSWGAWEFVGRIFGASDDPSMGIQYMFFWLMTIPFGWLLSFAGTKAAMRSGGTAAAVATVMVAAGVYTMFWLAGG